MNIKQADISRFYKHISTINFKTQPDICWMMDLCCADNGYHRIAIDKKSRDAHRVSYIIHKGPIPDDLQIRHICHNKRCVNPNHLIIGTHQDNMDDRSNADRQAKGSNNGNSLLTETLVREIIIDIWNGKYISAAEIGRKYEVYDTTILDILNGKRWTHITNQLQVPLLDIKMKLKSMSI